jgi:hypothetical protein
LFPTVVRSEALPESMTCDGAEKICYPPDLWQLYATMYLEINCGYENFVSSKIEHNNFT